MGRKFWLPLLVLIVAVATAALADDEPTFFEEPATDGGGLLDRVHLGGWINVGLRSSDDHRVGIKLDEDTTIWAETPDPGTTFELADVTLLLDADLSPSVTGHVKLDFIDLYDRNPTSTDYLIDVDEAWVRFGHKYEAREMPPGTHLYALVGKAPKFEKQMVRSLESYGLVSTAMNRMEDIQLQLGGSFGRHLYWRAQVSSGNPLFMRDPGFLAGDNGTVRTADEERDLNTGFPILYDAEVEWLHPASGTTELGGGLGFRIGRDDGEHGLDLLGFYYERDLADRQSLHGTFYGGDLDVLEAFGKALATDGRKKSEWGGNLDARWGGLGLFAQWVRQDIAGLERDGLEGELRWHVALPPKWAVEGRQLFTFLQPAVRWSRLDDHFGGVAGFPAPSFWWDWKKLDAGLRIGLLPEVDLTLEWSRQDVEAKKPFRVDEALATLHYGF